jgi:hypothetical protein
MTLTSLVAVQSHIHPGPNLPGQVKGLLDPRYRMLFVLMAKTGMRPGEAIALQSGDMDVRQHTIRIERAATMGGQVKSTKTAEVRTVDLSAKLIPTLEAYRAWQELESMTGRWGNSPWLCPNLRHTYASLLLSSGVPLLYVSQQLGHTNPTTTLRYYARWISTGDQRYVDVLDTAAEKSWHQTLAPEAQDDQKPLILGLPHHRRTMMMNHQPLISDALEEIRCYHLCLLRFVRLMGGDVLHADDPGYIACHLHHHVGELECHRKSIIEDQNPGVAHERPARPQCPARMDAGHVLQVRPNLVHLADVEIAKRGIKGVVRFVHFFDALFQHARLLS